MGPAARARNYAGADRDGHPGIDITKRKPAPRWEFLTEIMPFVKSFTLFFWATGTWWIPFLLLLGAWRHLYRHYPVRYDPQFWGMVFPLGMYAACTFQLAGAADLELLLPIAHGSVYVALAAWGTVRTVRLGGAGAQPGSSRSSTASSSSVST